MMRVPEGCNGTDLVQLAAGKYGMAFGVGLGEVAGKVFRIGHLGDTNELTIMGALAGVEMGFDLAGVPHKKGGVQAAMTYLAETATQPKLAAAE